MSEDDFDKIGDFIEKHPIGRMDTLAVSVFESPLVTMARENELLKRQLVFAVEALERLKGGRTERCQIENCTAISCLVFEALARIREAK